MIKLEHEVFASAEQIKFIIEGMRNPMNSWDKSDSEFHKEVELDLTPSFYLGDNDKALMRKLAKAGTDHRKFMRMMPVYVRITAPLYWWKEFDTYKVGTVANSCSTMHKITEKKFELKDFSMEHLVTYGTKENLYHTIDMLNNARTLYLHWDKQSEKDLKELREHGINSKKDIWWHMIQLLPSSYNQTRNVMLNYEVLANIYHSRKNHKLDEWRDFCKWIEEKVPYSWLITEIDKEEIKIIADNKVYLKY